MSGTQPSTFYPVNQMLADNAQQIANLYAPQRNQMLLAQGQQQLAGNEMEMLGRAAQGILNLPDDQQAAAYPGVVANLQRMGFAKNAPSAYPGKAALQQFVGQAIPVENQYRLGIVTPPGLTAALAGANAPLPGQAAPSGSPPGATTDASLPSDPEAALQVIAHRESGGRNIPNQQGPGGAPASSASGYFQITDPTWREGAALAGVDISQYPHAMNAPYDVQHQIARTLYDKYGATPWAASAPKAPGTAVAATTAAPGGTAGGVAARTGGYDVATRDGVPVAPAGTTAAPVANAAGGIPVPGNPGMFTYADGRVGSAPDANNAVRFQDGSYGTPPKPAATTAAPAVPQTPTNQVAPGGANGPPAPPPAPVQQQPVQQPLATGLQSQQVQAALELNRRAAALEAAYPYSPAAKAQAAALRAQAQIYMQADVEQEATRNGIHGQINLRTGQFTPDPARRMITRADGSVINDQGQVIAPAMPGATPPLGSFETQQQDYRNDAKDLPEIAAKGQAAQTAQVRWQAMLDLADKITTGAGGQTRTQLANLAETAGFPGIAQTLIAHSSEGDAAAAQEFSKLALASAGASERGDLGSRGSLGAIKLYQQANPNLDLRPGANKAIIGMQLIAAQADADYAQAALSFGNKYANDFRSGAGPYVPLSNFDQQWQQQRNPQVYAAAMGALAGQPAYTAGKTKGWSDGLSPAEYQRALNVVSRASPSAKVQGRDGGWLSMQPNANANQQPAAPAVVNTPAEAAALPPGTTYRTPDGRTFTR